MKKGMLVVLIILGFVIFNNGLKKEVIPISQCNMCSGNTAVLDNNKIICERDYPQFSCSISSGCLECTETGDGGGVGDCTDSDGGDYPKTWGYVDFDGASWPDKCAADLGATGSTELFEKVCVDEQMNAVIKECKDYGSDYTCSDGACVQGASSNDCIDTDGGNDIYVKGHITKSGGIDLTPTQMAQRTDSCSGNNLLEYDCHIDSPYAAFGTSVNCVNGCFDGACLLSTCTDADEDGYGTENSEGCTYSGIDCDDSIAWIYPGANENCNNGFDDNCDGKIDAQDATCGSTCTDWTPLPSTICAGKSFNQTSATCGKRVVWGTKTGLTCYDNTCDVSTCSDWSLCSNNIQTRECGDSDCSESKSCIPQTNETEEEPPEEELPEGTCNTDDDCMGFIQTCKDNKCKTSTFIYGVGAFFVLMILLKSLGKKKQ